MVVKILQGENRTKAILGRGCVKEFLACFLKRYGEHVLLAYGGAVITNEEKKVKTGRDNRKIRFKNEN